MSRKIDSMKRLILLITLFSFISCKEKFNPKEFKGTWFLFGNNDSLASPVITFKNDSIFLEDSFCYPLNYKYEVKDDKFVCISNSDTLIFKFNFERTDTTLTFDKQKYFFSEGHLHNNSPKEYELINTNSKNKITIDSLNTFKSGFHLLKDSDKNLLLKLNDKYTNDLNILTHFAFQSHKPIDTQVMYIGDDVNLTELIECFKKLYQVNTKKAMLITCINMKKKSYCGFLDEFEFWDRQLFEMNSEPISRSNNSRKKFIIKHKPTVIKIYSKKDFEKLNHINKKDKYLISISSNLKIEDYINLKEKIFKIDKNIRTEFILE